MKLLITNLAYGDYPYSDLFLEHHLKTMLDDSNIPAFRDRVEYVVYTDHETLPKIKAHKNIQKLAEMIDVHLTPFKWPQHIGNHYEARYNIQLTTFIRALDMALEKGYYLCFSAADSVVASGFLAKMFQRIDEGYGAVFGNPMRGAGESMAVGIENVHGALTPKELFSLAFKHLHPLWIASHWNAPRFSKIPYTILWGLESGLVARSFSVSPIVFKPLPIMRKTSRVMDVEIPSMCENPFWASDWTDCPIAGAEPLLCYYPPFGNTRMDLKVVREWAKQRIHSTQFANLEKKFFYPDRQTVEAAFTGCADEMYSDFVVQKIINEENSEAIDSL